MPTLSIIIPAYNEATTIEELLRRVKNAPLPNMNKEIIVVDDGSKDGTRDILKTIPGIRYIFHEKNLGKGGAVKTGIKHSTGDFVIFQDADLEYDPRDYSAMVQPLIDGKAEITNGVRIAPKHDPRRRRPDYWFHWLGNSTITLTTNILYGNNSAEYEGCYRVFRRDLLNSVVVHTNNFDFDNELVCKLMKRGNRVVDVPIRYYPRDYTAGKKINWKHGFLILWTIIKTRFTD